MQEKEISRLVHIRITRSPKGLLKWIPARVLINNRYTGFYPAETKEFDTEAGELTVIINKSKDLTFEAIGTETREFVIKEGYTDIGFVLKYLVLLSALGWLLYTFIFTQPKNYDPSISFFATLFTLWIGWQLRNEYFYLEEK
jgi:hypothetical protein